MNAAAVAQAPSFASAVDTGAAKPATADTTPKPGFKPSWDFSAWLFGTFTYQVDSATKAANGGHANSQFMVDRAYLNFRGQVAPDFGFRITTDVKTLPAGNGMYNGLVIRLKYAYLQWDYLRAATPNGLSAWARIGSIHTVVIEDEEHFWPRWIQKTALEYWGFQPGAADMGASTQFTLPGRWGWAYFTVGNGGGYQTAVDADPYKDMALRFSLTPLSSSKGFFRTLQITPWGQVGRTQATALTKPGLQNNAGGLFVGNADPRVTFGVEFAERQVQTLPDTVKITTTAMAWDGFVVVRPSLFADPKGRPWGVILRYDDWKANTSNSAHRTLLLASVFLDVAKQTSFGITYQDDVGHAETTVVPTKTMWQLNWQLTF